VQTDCITPAMWTAVEELAERLGPRTQGLVAARNVVGLRCWLAYAAPAIERRSPELAALYATMLELIAPSLAIGDVDRYGNAA
jgi:hypothetical protein